MARLADCHLSGGLRGRARRTAGDPPVDPSERYRRRFPIHRRDPRPGLRRGPLQPFLALSPARGTTSRAVALLLATLFVFGLAAQQRLGARLKNDGFFYVAFLWSIVNDHNVSLANDYGWMGIFGEALLSPTPTGYAQATWEAVSRLAAGPGAAERRAAVTHGALFAACALVGFLPQLIAWNAIYGSPLAVSPFSPKMFRLNPDIVRTLWPPGRSISLADAPLVPRGRTRCAARRRRHTSP
jgi:hypothetical protein